MIEFLIGAGVAAGFMVSLILVFVLVGIAFSK